MSGPGVMSGVFSGFLSDVISDVISNIMSNVSTFQFKVINNAFYWLKPLTQIGLGQAEQYCTHVQLFLLHQFCLSRGLESKLLCLETENRNTHTDKHRKSQRWQCAFLWCTAICECHNCFPVVFVPKRTCCKLTKCAQGAFRP